MNVVITGASRGIGKAIAEIFLENGHSIYTCNQSENRIQEVLKEWKSKFPDTIIEHYTADLSIEKEVREFAAWVNKQGPVHILVNNAGIYLPGNCFNEPEGSLQKMMAVNFYSAYHLTRALLPNMMERNSGHVFNLCSIASLHAYEGGGGYSVSKYALKGFTDNLRHEMKTRGIKVTGVYPGAVHTDSWSGFDNSSHRIMEASDIARMIYAASRLSPQAVVEEIIIRPQRGDL
ncbi:MAG: SDR family oxidoreductase [Chitinophagaceae bacterium]|nr:SDR family oxidoreductase [Bacteroidota bacterium]MCC6258851.1 SDR family oxidoreductase [Chitinophagaceae bacterium]MCW5917965.1 SDR family oxidoreductase [Ferruginibacter sp.]